MIDSNGIVQNIAVCQDDYQTPGGDNYWNPGSQFTLVDVTNDPSCQIGCTYDGTIFTLPNGG